MPHTLHLGDCLDILRTMPDNSVDAVVTDPPYGLSFMGKRWDYDVPSEDIWRECLRVLKPGGHLLAFAGTRTQHRMAVRIEDAGFEIRDMIAWVYGSGFPKSLDVSKAIDKAAGAEREVVGISSRHGGGARVFESQGGMGYATNGKPAITAPATPAARQWHGWGTALKPALEPITVARKPLIGTVAENVLTWGTGGVNVDGCRVGVHDGDKGGWRPNCYGKGYQYHNEGEFLSAIANGSVAQQHPAGRWPANLIHDGSEEVVGLFPDSIARPVRQENIGVSGTGNHTRSEWTIGGKVTTGYYDIETSAARFFYCAKASKRDRDEGCEGMEAKACGMMEDDNYAIKTGSGNARNTRRTNHHPTVKPTDLMRYLCKLVTPPEGTVLDPFMGSGSTGKAAVLEGFNFIGIEREPEYLEIARARITHAQEQKETRLL